MIPHVKIHRAPGAKLPERATPGSAALDLHACLAPDTEMILTPGSRATVPTGLTFEIPEGYFISLRPRSGLALREGLILPNAPATIDADFRGELKVIVGNINRDPVRIRHGDRIAQLLLEQIQPFAWEEVESLDELSGTERGTGGFGSTGLA
ncbi:MAG: dUTP diphosphatase [Leptospirales bacterium]